MPLVVSMRSVLLGQACTGNIEDIAVATNRTGNYAMADLASIMPVLFVAHGGGPLPLLNDPSHQQHHAFLTSIAAQLPQPTAILLITAHWEANEVALTSSQAPGMLYDYSGFPAESYQYRYPAPGAPELALQVQQLLQSQGVPCRLDSERGYDHGTFVPLMLMYPKANIPVLQMSLLRNLDAAAHINIGKALADLRSQGVLIVGSGMSFHNLRALMSGDPRTSSLSSQFDEWLTAAITAEPSQMLTKLEQWQQAPAALFAHPRAEHLLPLHVCAGAAFAAGRAGECNYQDWLFNGKVSGYIWR